MKTKESCKYIYVRVFMLGFGFVAHSVLGCKIVIYVQYSAMCVDVWYSTSQDFG